MKYVIILTVCPGAGDEEPAPQEEAPVSRQDVQQQTAREVRRARLHLGHSYALKITRWNKTLTVSEFPWIKTDVLCSKGWLDDIGLPQYKDQFNEGRVDGQMLQYITVVRCNSWALKLNHQNTRSQSNLVSVFSRYEFEELFSTLTYQKLSFCLPSTSERLVIPQSDQPAASSQHQVRHSCSPRQQVPPKLPQTQAQQWGT